MEDIRPLKPEDYNDALALLQRRASWMSVPPMSSLIGKFRDGQLVALIGFQRPPVVECLVSESGGEDARDLILWLDGALSHEQKYYFFISNTEFQEFVEKRYNDVLESFEGKLYTRIRK
jgi:hypothetical protein